MHPLSPNFKAMPQSQPKVKSRESIPLEIIDTILGLHAEANDGNTLLHPCSLVSPSWSTICSRYLSQGAKFRLVSRQQSDLFYNNLARYPLHAIRNITLFIQPAPDEDDEDLSAFDRHLQSSNQAIEQLNGRINVNTLAIAMDFASPLLNHQEYRDFLHAPFSQIVRLDLDLRMETFNSLFLFISSFSRVEILGISCGALLDDLHNEPRIDLTLPPLLRTLQLNIILFHGFAGDTFWGWLRGQTMPNLRELSILNCDSASSPEERVPTYLQLSSELTSVYLSIPSDEIDPLSYLGEDEEDASGCEEAPIVALTFIG
ncbi:hypothetical protein VNI00_014788 [Paramarasmius palmivorus]|uniref:F-box domain-containing protein n=1 Tax=Paramarasmius palmivorus TaxID=297713 RepID=A0AAW0BS21_9AGAR